MGIVLIGIVAALVGIGIGYVTWGRPARTLQEELTRTAAQAREVAGREGAAATRIQEVEAQTKQVAAELAAERDRREQLEALTAKLKR